MSECCEFCGIEVYGLPRDIGSARAIVSVALRGGVAKVYLDDSEEHHDLRSWIRDQDGFSCLKVIEVSYHTMLVFNDDACTVIRPSE